MSSMNKSPDQAYWRSLRELGDTPEFRRFLEAEFPEEAQVPTDALSRRRFLQLMGGSVALAGLAGCRWPVEKIVPFAERPEGVLPGESRRFATSLEIAGDVRPVVVTSYDGRPIKIEGNPGHPLSLGAADLFAQAALLDVYDPDRSTAPRRRGQQTDWDAFEAWAGPHFADLAARRGAGLAFLVERSSSPTRARLREQVMARFPDAGWYEWEPVSRDNARLGAAQAFGHPVETTCDLGAARVIACFDADPLGEDPAALRNARRFADGRRAENGEMNRLYVVENSYSTTGAMADHRFALPSRDVGYALLQLAAELHLHQGLDLPGFGALKEGFEEVLPHAPAWIPALARDLMDHRGEGVVAVGPRQPEWVHALAHLLNRALGNTGRTVLHQAVADPGRPHHGSAMGSFADGASRGRIRHAVILGGNPAFDGPADLDLRGLLTGLESSVHLATHVNETSALCTWHLPMAHALESWGDVRDLEGRYGVVQPLIRPLHGGRSVLELLRLLADGEATPPRDLVRETARTVVGDDEDAWLVLLRDGVHDAPAAPTAPELDGRGIVAAVRGAAKARRDGFGADSLEVVFHRDPSLYDGRFANNAWLQELPDFMTKLTWDNAALVGVSTAAALGVKHGDVARLELDGRSLETAVYVLPGQAAWSISLQMGHGRTTAGRVGEGTGFDVYALRTAAAPDRAAGAVLKPTGRTYALAETQDHHAIDATGMKERERRSHALVVEGDLEEYRSHPEFAKHRTHVPPLVSLWEERKYEGHAWGMTIDLAACTGCNACAVACQAENNIPVVGKDQVHRGREMSWIRLDRYFQGDPDEARVAHQPVGCVHCEMAPCEQVCPVGATMHTAEGLNAMVYNRCVGTRYCANNCPYKVRRFNFYNFNSEIPEIRQLAYNPEVTLRARGVMEKCTYCVQRIEQVKIDAKNAGRPIRDGEITTACQQTCPSQAIVFGDLNDPESRVHKTTAEHRAYHLLGELNVKPRTSYLARLRNPNPELVESSDGHAAH